MQFKKGDKIVLILIFLFFLSFAIARFFKTDDASNKVAIIEMNGEEYKTIELFKDMEKEEIRVDLSDDQHFRVIAENGQVKMAESTCPNKICVNTGWISQVGESIVCLPYKTAIYVEKARGDDN